MLGHFPEVGRPLQGLSIDSTLGVLSRNVMEHECSWSPCEMEHSHGIRTGDCEEIFHQSQAKVNEGEVLSEKIQN